MKVLYVLSLLLVASLVAAAHGCVCTADYTPVCGVDGKTYSNACQLGCAGVEMARSGPCDGTAYS